MSKIAFKRTGKAVKDFIKKEKYKSKLENFSKKPVGIKLPLRSSTKDSAAMFEMTYNIGDQIEVNLKNLILTRKGEYLGMPDFGTNLIDVYNATDIKNIEDIAMKEIKQAVSSFMPFVNLTNFSSVLIKETYDNPDFYEIKIYEKILLDFYRFFIGFFLFLNLCRSGVGK